MFDVPANYLRFHYQCRFHMGSWTSGDRDAGWTQLGFAAFI